MRNAFYLLALLLVFCKQPSKQVATKPPMKVLSVAKSLPLTAFNQFTVADFFATSPALDSLVESRFAAMSDDTKAAQLIIHATSEQRGAALPFEKARALYAKNLVGGILFLKGDVRIFQKQIHTLDSISRQASLTPAAYACDCEPTLFHKKFLGVDSVRSAAFLKDTTQVAKAAKTIAAYIKQMGITINFAPVADAAENKEIINKRSFGTQQADIITKSTAFVLATQGLDVISSIKHFPGHGHVKGDTHKGQVSIDGALTELATFKEAIALSQPVMVMVGHMTVKNNGAYNTNGLPCTLSKTVITNLLKEQLRYKGIVITDAMRMNAVKAIPDADWKTIKAGADVVLIPVNPAVLHQKIKAALQQGEMKAQLEASVKKVIRMKVCLGLIK